MSMTDNNKLALIVAYYLSRFDRDAYINLGYSSFRQAIIEIGKILNVKPNTVKNMRDEFDPYHSNRRIGWQRDLRGSRVKVLRAFQNTDEETLLEIIKEILFNKDFNETGERVDIELIFTDKTTLKKSSTPILRGPTGRRAEAYFMDYQGRFQLPMKGQLIDRRDYGCGYDFEICNGNDSFFIEVKGLAAKEGGVLFTNKEWKTAVKNGSKYFLVLIKNLQSSPEVIIIQDPALKLKAERNIYTTIQVNWAVNKVE